MESKKFVEGLENDYPFIIIDNYKFTLEGKINDRTWNYWNVYISSEDVNTKEVNKFWVYPSNSELGLWRLSANINDIKYKGERISSRMRKHRPPGDYFYYDYVQQTCIYIELQVFINQHFDTLPVILSLLVNLLTPHKPYSTKSKLTRKYNDTIIDMIDNPHRQIQLSPFILLQKIIECGEIETITPRKRTPVVVIKEFSQQLKREYELLYYNIEIVAPYNKVFQNMININGHIMKFPLKNKRDGTIVILYACIVKMAQIPTSKGFRNSATNIHRICGKDLHIMPFFLTTEDSTINCFGVYTKYIPCGAFICKLFDYSSGYHKLGGYIQCTEDEFSNNHCTDSYSYVGDRFDNIFPFNEWIKKNNLLYQAYSRKSGVKSASPKKSKTMSRIRSF